MNTTKALAITILALSISSVFCRQSISQERDSADTLKIMIPAENAYDVIIQDSLTRYTKLTDEDYSKVAKELDIDIATIRAVVDIEAGKEHKGFASPGVPIINFDKSIFSKLLKRAGISPNKYSRSIAFSSVNIKKYGSYSKAQFARLEAGRKISADIANMATFWGMFQIGGFNWKRCGSQSIDEFVYQMSYSEEMQLELFARFIINNDMVKFLRRHDWRGFARAYNGPSYASKGYHKRLAAAYAKYK